MGNTNAVPVVSQVKSAVLAATGDREGARQVQSDFIHECPIASQITSAVYAAKGDRKKAVDTQKRCGKGLLSAADGVPVVGHIKGGIHYACGDKEGGKRAMISASRTVAVIAGGVGGTIVAGPIGAISGGIAAGSAVDGAITGFAYAVHHEYRPSGVVELVNDAIKKPNAENIFEATLAIFMDGLCGAIAGTAVEYGPAKMTRTQWRRFMRKNAKLRAKGNPLLRPPRGSALFKPSRIYNSTNVARSYKWYRNMRTRKGGPKKSKFESKNGIFRGRVYKRYRNKRNGSSKKSHPTYRKSDLIPAKWKESPPPYSPPRYHNKRTAYPMPPKE